MILKEYTAVNATILITQDRYLYQGIKNYFPDVIRLYSVDRRSFSYGYKEYAVLVDSRLPLEQWENIITSAEKAEAPVRCIMLDMRHSELSPLRLKWSLDMSMPYRDIEGLFWLLQKVKLDRQAGEWFYAMRLSQEERKMMMWLRKGLPMEAVAEKLCTSLKSLYRRRNELHERLGLANFNEACLLIYTDEEQQYP
ncbi:LuxR family transcriptional regulator [Enterobacter sp. Ap-1006]|nr:LuxR family transcriptional regulator [Enterobacter sp. Ap-1006]NIF47585.1 LuxR family transcriptional regulator [Enterobacter sp. Ap-1006]